MIITKKRLILFFIVSLFGLLSLYGCASGNTGGTILSDYEDSILLIDLSRTLDISLRESFETTSDLNFKSDKHYKFIVISDFETDNIDLNILKEKILDGYYVIYAQTDKVKLNKFTKQFNKNIPENDGNALGVILQRNINLTSQSLYIEVLPFYSTAECKKASDFIKTAISNIIIPDKPNKSKEIFLGLYISKAIPFGNDLKETSPFTSETTYDKFDIYNYGDNKEFTYNYDTDGQKVVYIIKYRISKDDMEFFCPYLIVKDFYGKIKAIPLSGSYCAHSAITYSLTKETPVYSGILKNTELKEYLKVTFNFI